MATVGTLPASERGTAPAVRTCYDLLTVLPACGVTDLTDGKYLDGRNDRAAYLAAQERQVEYLLDQARCGVGTRLLDIGCGYGRILQQAAQSWHEGDRHHDIAAASRIWACARVRCSRVELSAYFWGRCCVHEPSLAPPYKGGESEWEHAFDAVTANGSLEHFVQAADAAAGRADEIYGEMFAICRRLLVDGGRFVSTAIHLRDVGQFDPKQIALGSAAS